MSFHMQFLILVLAIVALGAALAYIPRAVKALIRVSGWVLSDETNKNADIGFVLALAFMAVTAVVFN